MKFSIPKLPGVYYDTDAESTAITIALTAAGRKAPKPQGYALQLAPYLWSFDVDLREVPADHPFQYLHPEGARSIDQLSRSQLEADLGADADRLARFLWEVSEETERSLGRVLGREETEEGIVIEIQTGDGTIDETPDPGPADLADDEAEGLEADKGVDEFGVDGRTDTLDDTGRAEEFDRADEPAPDDADESADMDNTDEPGDGHDRP
ncbi:hypothetical protein [Natrononativus amylolyticus]|uniref:hypothetical protein n=1 Tax=Natrononativus amylolyticus TaxID=2963434 RepID=UPI0020CD7C10|nr:hypothetical protein [Natrononativus amylolyticus]